MTVPTEAPASTELLAVRGVGKSYGRGPKPFVALTDVSLDVRVGEFVCLLGPSGCGKSTLLRIVTGLAAPTTGTVTYRGAPLTGVNPHATIVFQTFALFPWLTVQDNVEIALKARGVPAAARSERARKLLDVVGLDGFESAFPRELSGGMRQKVGFARAMAVEPELLCLDEPFSALDVLSAEALRGELLELWLAKTVPIRAVLMVTHNIDEAVFLADRIVVMGKDPGHVVTEVAVTLRHPRRHKDPAFQALSDRVYAAVAGRTAVEPPAPIPGQRAPLRPLPRARLNAVAGLVEKLATDGGRADLYRLGADLGLELDDLLPVVEAAELLGFGTVAEGGLELTALGRTYAEASIVVRKEMIAGRVLRVPLIAWIYEILQRADDRRVSWWEAVAALESEFGAKAEGELENAINFGRFAELFAYDDAAGELFLEKS